MGSLNSSKQELLEEIQTLKQTEAQFHHYFEALPLGAVIVDANLRFVHINLAFAGLLGYSVQELLLLSIPEITYPDDVLEDFALAKKLIDGELKELLLEKRYLKKSGEIVWVRLQIRLTQSGEGAPIHFLCVIVDINSERKTRSALAESENKYRVISEMISDFVFSVVVNEDGSLTREWVTKGYTNITGYSPEEREGMGIFSFFSITHKKQFYEELNKLVQTPSEASAEICLLAKDGSIRWVLFNAKSLLSECTNKVDRIIGAGKNITEQKNAELTIKRHQDRLLSLHHLSLLDEADEKNIISFALEESVRLTDSKFGYFHFVNEDQISIDSMHFSTKVFAECAASTQKQHVISRSGVWADSIRTKQPAIHNNYNAVALSGMLPDGHVPIFRHLSIPIIRSDKVVAVAGLANKDSEYKETDILHFRLFVEDMWKIIEKKRDKDQLRKLYRAIEQSSSLVLITDLSGAIEYVNPKFSEVTQYSFAEVKGKNPSILNSGETDGDIYAKLWQTILSGNEWIGEFHNKKKNGDLFWDLSSISPIKNEMGETTHFIAVKDDISDRKNLELRLTQALQNAEESSRLKSSLLANMSHELRTPMNGILGFAQLLEEEIEDTDHKRMIKNILSSGKRLMGTLNSIMELSEVESSAVRLQHANIDICAGIQEILSDFSKMIQRKELYIHTNFPDDPIFAASNRKFFDRIISNLIDNAVKFTRKGGITVSVSKRLLGSEEIFQNPNREQFAGAYVFITVSDTGIGIAPHNHSIIFEAFRQVSEGFGREFEGSGIGLTLCRKMARILGGDIIVESKLGSGALFSFVLPFDDSLQIALPADVLTPQVVTVVCKPNGKPEILFVEDNLINQEVVKSYLQNSYSVNLCPDGETALRMINEKPYVLILMDINLGLGLNGIDTAAAIRSFEFYREVPIIAITGYAMSGDKERLLAKGFSHYLAKPFSKTELLALLNEVFLSVKKGDSI